MFGSPCCAHCYRYVVSQVFILSMIHFFFHIFFNDPKQYAAMFWLNLSMNTCNGDNNFCCIANRKYIASFTTWSNIGHSILITRQINRNFSYAGMLNNNNNNRNRTLFIGICLSRVALFGRTASIFRNSKLMTILTRGATCLPFCYIDRCRGCVRQLLEVTWDSIKSKIVIT